MLTGRVMLMRVGQVADIVAGFLAIRDRIVFCLQSCHHAPPMFDDLRRLPVNFEPDERLAENPAMRQGTLYARMCTKISKAPLEHQRLTKPFDVTAGEWQFAQFQRRRLSFLVV